MGGNKEKQEEMHLGVQVFTYGFGETNKTLVKMTDFQVSNERNPGCLGYIYRGMKYYPVMRGLP